MQREAARAIEAILMVADEPIGPNVLAQVLEVSEQDVVAMCDELMAAYEVNDAGFVLQRVAGGYRFQSHPDLAAYVERFVLEGQSARLSSAAMETLAIVAYKQPVSRAQVAAIRGVNVDGVMRTLQQRDLIEEVSRDPGPGQAVLFGTTTSFLERLGLDSVDDLPPLGQFVPGADVFEALERGLRPESPEEVAASAAADVQAADDADDEAQDAAGPERYGTAEAESVVDDQGQVDRTTLAGDEGDIGEGGDELPPLDEVPDLLPDDLDGLGHPPGPDDQRD
jgi:segregation and condensation protein B